MSTLISLINRLLPKRNIIVFNSFPDISGNALALYKYILSQRPDITHKYTIVWSVGNISVDRAMSILRRNTEVSAHRVMNKKSFRGIITYLYSKYIISTHGYFPGIRTSVNQKHINLWHGMPFKRIGRLLEEEIHSNGKKDEADITIATSEIFQTLMAKAFDIPESSVYVTGQPCADALVTNNNVLIRFGICKRDFRKIIVWMPTYRKSVIGDIRSDGDENSFGVLDMLRNHFGELDMTLKTQNFLLIIKPHPMDAICNLEFPESNNIKVLKNLELSEHEVELYEMLSESDLLITDYSSVFIDYLVTGKPIAFVCNDLETYEGTRGFCFNPPREYMPGELITNCAELLYYFEHMDLINDAWSEKYEGIKKMFYPFSDDLSSKRVCDAINF